VKSRYPAALLAALLVPLAAPGQPVKSDAPLGPQGFPRGALAAPDAPVKSDTPLLKSLSAEKKAEHAKQFPRGLKGRTPAEVRRSVPKFQAAPAYAAAATQFAFVPAKKSMWGNNQYGDCVSAEAACSMAAYTTYCGRPTVPTDAEVIAFARKWGWLNGAYLTEVLDRMRDTGMSVGGSMVKSGPYAEVDYRSNGALQTALTVGPLDIAIDADALPSSAGNKDGWYVTGNTHSPNTDHCVPILGFGPAGYLYEQINTPLPAALKPDQQGFLVFTWSTIGFVDFNWVQGTVVESYVRNPTTVGFTPPTPQPPAPPTPPVPPTPVPPQPPTPTPGPGPFTGSIYYQNGVIVGFGPLPGPTPPAPKDDGTAFLEKAKVCPALLVAGLQLYVAYQTHDPAQIAAATAAFLAAYQSCQTPAQSGFTAPGAGDCGQVGFAAGACSSAGAGACGPAGAGFSLRHPFGGRFAAYAPAAQSCGPESGSAAGSCGQATATAYTTAGGCSAAATAGACGSGVQQQSGALYRVTHPFGGRFRR
jgi:hypothetical protein